MPRCNAVRARIAGFPPKEPALTVHVGHIGKDLGAPVGAILHELGKRTNVYHMRHKVTGERFRQNIDRGVMRHNYEISSKPLL